MKKEFLRKNVWYLSLGVVALAVVTFFGSKLYIENQHQQEISQYLEKNKPVIPAGYEQEIIMHGLFPDEPTFTHVISSADVILEGTVFDVTPAYSDEHGILYHDVVIKPEKFLENTPQLSAKENINVTVLGGGKDKYISWGEDLPAFRKGEKVLVALAQSGSKAGSYYVSYDAYGKFTIEGDRIVGIASDQGLIDTTVADMEKRIKAELANK